MTDPATEYDNMTVCAHPHADGKNHRFSHYEDWQLHEKYAHQQKDILAEMAELLEQILITVSRY